MADRVPVTFRTRLRPAVLVAAAMRVGLVGIFMGFGAQAWGEAPPKLTLAPSGEKHVKLLARAVWYIAQCEGCSGNCQVVFTEPGNDEEDWDFVTEHELVGTTYTRVLRGTTEQYPNSARAAVVGRHDIAAKCNTHGGTASAQLIIMSVDIDGLEITQSGGDAQLTASSRPHDVELSEAKLYVNDQVVHTLTDPNPESFTFPVDADVLLEAAAFHVQVRPKGTQVWISSELRSVDQIPHTKVAWGGTGLGFPGSAVTANVATQGTCRCEQVRFAHPFEDTPVTGRKSFVGPHSGAYEHVSRYLEWWPDPWDPTLLLHYQGHVVYTDNGPQGQFPFPAGETTPFPDAGYMVDFGSFPFTTLRWKGRSAGLRVFGTCRAGPRTMR